MLWAEHLAAYHLFGGVQTQWAWDQGRPTGLRYEGVRASPAFNAVPADQREAAFADLVCIERGYLARLSQRRQFQQRVADRG